MRTFCTSVYSIGSEPESLFYAIRLSMAKEAQHGADSYLVTWTVEPGENGQRLDAFLKQKYRKLSRERLKRSIKEGRVTLNHEATKPSRILQEQDKVYVKSIRGEEPEVDLNYKVLYEDEHFVAVDKPGNLPVHPSGRFFFHTLLTQLKIVNANEVDQRKDFYIVHRVDRETSGVLLMGKTQAAATNLIDQFYDRIPKKEYLAIARGCMEKDYYEVDEPLAKDPHSAIKLKMGVVERGADGKALYINDKDVMPAKTIFEVLRRVGDYTLVRAKPHTGRQHQIRVHLDFLGHPIVGDKLYGAEDSVFFKSLKEVFAMEVEPNKFLSRHALHAHKISFLHPATKEKMEIECPLAEELEAFLVSIQA